MKSYVLLVGRYNIGMDHQYILFDKCMMVYDSQLDSLHSGRTCPDKDPDICFLYKPG